MEPFPSPHDTAASASYTAVRLRLAGRPTPRKPKKRYSATSWRCAECETIDLDEFMLGCDGCDRWFHGACCGVSIEEAEAAQRWWCDACSRRTEAAVKQ
eukprot:3662496-Prymnesium_polylepis.1